MKTHPMLFSTPMVQALLAGRKTQTRRVLKIRGHKEFSHFGKSDINGYDWRFRGHRTLWQDLTDQELKSLLTHKVGDLLWVRETWRPRETLQPWDLEVIYNADGESRIIKDGEFGDNDWTMPKAAEKGNVSSLFMPRWASRLTLKITDVRVERLQDISEADAMAEGSDRPFVICEDDDTSYRQGFESLWKKINGEQSWDENPFVTALTFEVIEQNIDQLIK